MLDEHLVEVIEDANIHEIRVRSAVTCKTRFGVCAKCYGRDLGRGHVINLGEAVGIIAAQSIGEPGTQLTLRTFHIGGAASESRISQITVKTAGVVHLKVGKMVKNSENKNVILTRSNELIVRDQNGRERERHELPYGTELSVEEGSKVEIDQSVASWDRDSEPMITEVSGTVSFENVEEGVTVTKQTDELTGSSTFQVIDPQKRFGSAQNIKPAILIKDKNGEPVKFPGVDADARYQLESNSIVVCADGEPVHAGDILARLHREIKNRDIVGGMPRVVELFEARKPKESAVLAQSTGRVSFGKETKSKRRLEIKSDEGETSVLIPKERNIIVFDGQSVERGEIVVDGLPLASDILEYRGVEELADYIVTEVQRVYQLQGVKINDKHIEVILRQMLRKVKVIDPGDSEYLRGEQVEKSTLFECNDKLEKEGKVLARYELVLLGITKASLHTESFISAASFQETTRVLTDASVNGKTDALLGLKENVIVGRLIPAGTGLAYHQERKQRRMENQQEEQELEELLNTATEESVAASGDADVVTVGE